MCCVLSRFLVLFTAFFFMTASLEASPAQPGTQTPQRFRETVTTEVQLDYLLFLPKGYDSSRKEGWPLMLFLHGAGERGSDLSRVKIHGPAKRAEKDADFPFIVVSPQCPAGEVWESAPLLHLLDRVIKDHNVDGDRVYLTGLSMGGYGSWALAVQHPERFAAVAPICGGGQPIRVWLAEDLRKERLKRLPVWAFHGAKDPVVPLEESERMVDAFKRIGADNVKLTVYPEANHDSWTETYANPDFFEWMLSHRLDQ
jgi:predicted peptidase